MWERLQAIKQFYVLSVSSDGHIFPSQCIWQRKKIYLGEKAQPNLAFFSLWKVKVFDMHSDSFYAVLEAKLLLQFTL